MLGSEILCRLVKWILVTHTHTHTHTHTAEDSRCEWAVTGSFNPLQVRCSHLPAPHLHPIHHCLPAPGEGPSQSIPSFVRIPTNGLQQMSLGADRRCLTIAAVIWIHQGGNNSINNKIHEVLTEYIIQAELLRTVRSISSCRNDKRLYLYIDLIVEASLTHNAPTQVVLIIPAVLVSGLNLPRGDLL